VSEPNLGIIGGGIGGVAAALALHQAGIDSVVYERAPELREVGAGMMLWPNATRVLRNMGLLENIQALGGPSSHFLVRATCGKVLMNIALGEFDVPSLGIRRCDLLAVLLAALPPACIRLGHKLDRLEQSSEKVRVSFEKSIVKEHSAVIGADGLRSRVRSQLFDSSPPIYRGYTVWRGVAKYHGGAIGPGANSETWGAGKRFGIIDVGQENFTWYATANLPENHLDVPRNKKRELQKAFLGWHQPIADLIDATDEENIIKSGAYDRRPLPSCGAGLVTLLGDAAHPCTPNLGQAGCLALEDAAVLAKCVGEEKSLEVALRRYESLRRQRTKHIQQRSRLMGEIGQWENRLFVTGRRIVTSLLPARLFEHNLRRMYSYQT